MTNVQSMRSPAGCSSGGCAREFFSTGRIYLKSGVGVHELHGPVLAYYRNHGGTGGALGFPASDVSVSSGIASARFEHGTVTCTSSGCSQA
jgi:uncharacterized protein with LGFP repeats